MDEEAAVERATRNGASYAEARVETVEEGRISVEDGELRTLVAGSETGFGFRVLVDGAWGFASSNDLSADAWRGAVDSAVRLARRSAGQGRAVRLADAPVERTTEVWRPNQDPRDVAVEEKL
ncbi:MAG TPA: DNA gyrase modulator, partial [Candidatus Thermoplasmatota archaeon]|nr:DNA gyrase modulator [Candidatus Thermoplasmatota archaeon]